MARRRNMSRRMTRSELTALLNKKIVHDDESRITKSDVRSFMDDESRITKSDVRSFMDDLTPKYKKYEHLGRRTFPRKLAEEFVALFTTSLQATG